MGRRIMTRTTWERMLAAAREALSPTHLVREVGIDEKTARKAIDVGWPGLGLRPLRAVVHEEQQAARATAAERARLEAAATHDAVATRAEELTMVRGVRGNILRSLNVAMQLHDEAVTSLKRVPLDTTKLRPSERVAAYRMLATSTRELAHAADAVAVLERRVAGEPIAHVKVTGDDGPMTRERAREEFAGMMAMLDRADELAAAVPVRDVVATVPAGAIVTTPASAAIPAILASPAVPPARGGNGANVPVKP